MIDRLISAGVKQLFGGARRGQPIITGIGAVLSIWGLFRRYGRKEKLVYSRELKDGETLRIPQIRGTAAVSDEEA